jgi:hypothetical protein
VAVESGTEHEKAGSIRMYETLPFFSGRSTLEGVYNQASVITHPVYYLASELGATSPNPFRKREYSRFDTDAALAHLRMFNVSEVVAVSPQLARSLESRPGVERVAHMPPYTVFRLPAAGTGYVEPLAWAPVRSSPRGCPGRLPPASQRRPGCRRSGQSAASGMGDGRIRGATGAPPSGGMDRRQVPECRRR